MKVTLLALFLMIHGLSYADVEIDSEVIDTCDCPQIEDFSEDVFDIIQYSYRNDKPNDIPFEFDQLTLLMSLRSRLEVDLKCETLNGEINEQEKDLISQLSTQDSLEDILDGLSFSSNFPLENLNPELIRLATDMDRTLLFRAQVNGEEKYIAMRVNRSGDVELAWFERENIIQDQSERPLSLAGMDTSFPLGPESYIETSTGPPHTLEAPSLNRVQGRYGDIIRDEEGGVRVNTDPSGVSVEGATRTDNGDIVQAGVGIRAMGENLPGYGYSDDQGDEGPRRVTNVELSYDAAYVSGLGNSVVTDTGHLVTTGPNGERLSDDELELRFGGSQSFDSEGELQSSQTELGATYRVGDNALSLDVQRQDGAYQEEPTTDYELRLGNTDARYGVVSGVRVDTNISTPQLSFSSIPQLGTGGQHSFAGGKFMNAGNEEDAPDSAYSFGIQGDAGGEVTDADFSLFHKGEDVSSFMTGRYSFEDESYQVNAGRGNEEQRFRISQSFGEYQGRSTTVEFATHSEDEEEGAQRTVDTTGRIQITDPAYAYQEGGVGVDFDRVATTHATSDDELHSRSVQTHTGFSVDPDETVRLRFSRTSNDIYRQDSTPGEAGGLQEIGRRQNHFAAEVSVGDERQEVRAAAISESSTLGQTRGVAGDLHAVRDTSGESIEVGMSLAGSSPSQSQSCRVAYRSEQGYASAYAQQPQFGLSNRGARQSMNCNVTVVDSDTQGEYVEVSARYDVTTNTGAQYYVSVQGQTQTATRDADLNIGFHGNIPLNRPVTNSGPRLTESERQDLLDFAQQRN